MKQKYRKLIIITGIISILLTFNLFKANAQTGEEYNNIVKILTEQSVDIKYIKNNISEIKEDNQELQKKSVELGSRITRVEERQITIKGDLCDVTERNNWFLGLIGTLIILTLGLQLKRSYAHRKNNGKNNNKNN